LNSKGKYAILLLSSVLVIYAIIGGMLGRVSAQNGSYQQLSIFMEVLNRIQNDYVDEPTIKDAVAGAIRGLVESVDPYGGYLSPKDVAFYKDYNAQKTPGIGVVLFKSPRLGYPVIVSAIPGGPAAKAGLGTGDMIESIDGSTTREMNQVQINALLANPAAKPVAISVIRRRRAEPETVTLNRETVQAPAVEAKVLDNSIAYVKVPYLGSGKALEAKKQLDGLLKKGATSVVLDLRFTAGGEEQEGVQLANLFLESGTIGYLQGQKFEKRVLTVNPKEALTNVPLVVLVNQGSSGAAEIVAGAIADNHRGEVVGVKTFGTGSLQRLIPLEDGFGLLISVAKYHTPAGKEIQAAEPQDSGIRPTVEVQETEEEASDPNADDQVEVQPPAKDQPPVSGDDRQLKKAIEILKDPGKATKKAA
jgi:carboxyl-terminal processing protease